MDAQHNDQLSSRVSPSEFRGGPSLSNLAFPLLEENWRICPGLLPHQAMCPGRRTLGSRLCLQFPFCPVCSELGPSFSQLTETFVPFQPHWERPSSQLGPRQFGWNSASTSSTSRVSI